MALQDKLKTLRKQANLTTGAELKKENSLTQQIARITRARKINQREGFDDLDLAKELGAELIDEGVILKTKELPLDKVFGLDQFREIYAQDQEINFLSRKLNSGQLVFMDTETSGLSGGVGTVVFLLGMARINFERKTLTVKQYFLTRFSGEKSLLERGRRFLNDDDVLVTYNGKSFDVPLLGNRYRLVDSDCPFSQRQHLDLLHPMRRAFHKLWKDCRLNTAEKKLLEFFRKDDLPGSEAPWVWTEWIRFGIHNRVRDVMKHNYFDLVSLAGLLPKLMHVYQQPERYRADVAAIARWYDENDSYQQALHLLEQNRYQLGDEGLRQLAWHYRRELRWPEALEIWRELSSRGCTQALENIAKYYEHQQKDFESALDVTEILLDKHCDSLSYDKRRTRLQKKIDHANL